MPDHVKMQKGGVSADVHPDMAERWRRAGWLAVPVAAEAPEPRQAASRQTGGKCKGAEGLIEGRMP